MRLHANANVNIFIILIVAIIIISITLSPFNSATAARNVNLYQKAQQAQSEFLQKLEPLVNIDSGTGYVEGITKVEDIVIEHLKAIGAQIEITKATTGVGKNIIATIQGTSKSNRKNILLLAHSDTVFKEGTAAERPFKIVAGKAYGAGVMDDKGGIILGIEALK